MRIFRAIRPLGECLLVCIGLVTIPLLPRRMVCGLARFLGNAGYRFDTRIRRIARANLRLALGATKSEAEREAIARSAFRTFSLVLLDLFWFSVGTRRRIARYVRMEPALEERFGAGPVLVITGHYGNWEVLGQALALHGKRCVSVAASLGNPFVDWLLRRIRGAGGQQIAFKTGVVGSLVKALRSGQNIGLLMDQNTLPHDGGMFVDFFGLPVPMAKSAGLLARRTGAGILFAFCVPDGQGYYDVSVLPRLEPEGKDPSELTEAVAGTLEKAIAERPAQWLWMYKRWKYVPPEEDAGRYPWYARRYKPR